MHGVPPSCPISKARQPRSITASRLFISSPDDLEDILCRQTRLTELVGRHLVETKAHESVGVYSEEKDGKEGECFEKWVVLESVYMMEEEEAEDGSKEEDEQ